MTLIQLLQSGAVLRYKPHGGFYVVQGGQAIQISGDEARRAVNARQVLPAGIAGPGIYVFKLNTTRATYAVPAVRRDSQTLSARPAGVPNALPDVRPMRRAADSKTAAAVPADAGAAPGQVQAGAGGLGGARAQRERVAGAGQGGCMGCDAKGVTA